MRPPIKPSVFAWLSLLVATAGAGVAHSAPTRVFRAGEVQLPILIAVDAPLAERTAAGELGRVLGVMSGLAWDVRPPASRSERGLRLGRSLTVECQLEPLVPAREIFSRNAGKVGPDGFRIRTRAGSVFIEGATPEATGFAVAWLLQREGGVRWYAPGPAGEIVPRCAEWSLPEMDVTVEPAYFSREITGLESPAGEAWARHNGLGRRLDFGHALGRIFGPAVMAQHPDWAPLVRGTRHVPAPTDDRNWQPNLALPAVAEHAAAAAVAAFAAAPDRTSFSLGINDTVRFDQDAVTRELVEPLRFFRGRPDYSDLVFGFMNRAATAVSRAYPERYLGSLAYFWCESPPAFPVDAHVIPYVTSDRSQYFDPEFRAADLALMARWGASGVRAFGLWEYAYGRGFLIPRVPLGSLAESVRAAWQRGARGYLAEVEPQWGFDAFKVWMLAQLLWEPDRKLEDLAGEFFPGYYGGAAGPMRRFFQRCESQWTGQAGPASWLKLYGQEDQALLFPVDVCRELRGILAEAERTVAGDAVAGSRVAQTARAFAVTEAFGRADAIRRSLANVTPAELSNDEARVAGSIAALVRAEANLRQCILDANAGDFPAMAVTDYSRLVRNDPVPRLLWLCGRSDLTSARRLLTAAGLNAADRPGWKDLADGIATARVLTAPNVLQNSSFGAKTGSNLEPRFLYRGFGELPAQWDLRAMPTETGRVNLVAADPESSALRIEGAWDTQVYQWIPVEPDCLYLATARLRGRSSPGNDSALFLTFVDRDGKTVGPARMEALPKGLTSDWRELALADRAPDRAAWVGVGVGGSRQSPDDWLELAAVELRGAILDSSP